MFLFPFSFFIFIFVFVFAFDIVFVFLFAYLKNFGAKESGLHRGRMGDPINSRLVLPCLGQGEVLPFLQGSIVLLPQVLIQLLNILHEVFFLFAVQQV